MLSRMSNLKYPIKFSPRVKQRIYKNVATGFGLTVATVNIINGYGCYTLEKIPNGSYVYREDKKDLETPLTYIGLSLVKGWLYGLAMPLMLPRVIIDTKYSEYLYPSKPNSDKYGFRKHFVPFYRYLDKNINPIIDINE